jgi:hypothetical protein
MILVMAEHPLHIPSGRLLLFERDPLKRDYFQKYVLGILWRGLSEEEKQDRFLEVVEHRHAQSNGPGTEKCSRRWTSSDATTLSSQGGAVSPPRNRSTSS